MREEGYGLCRGCRDLWTAGPRLTTGPWTTLRVSLSHLENCCAVHHTAHSLDDDDSPTNKKENLQSCVHS